MVELSEATGQLTAAEQAIREATRHKALTPAEGQRKRAVVLLEQALAARKAGDADQALKLAREAHKLEPALVPATALLGELLIAAGRGREAGRMLEKAWPAQPHPELVRVYRDLAPDEDGLARVSRLAKLMIRAPEHPESHLALAEAALDADIWGEARRHLGRATAQETDGGPSERVCRLMARLEESYPREAENVLVTHPSVADAAVFGVPNEDFGEEVKAVVQPLDPSAAGPELERELIEFCQSQLAKIKCPRSVDFEAELPRHPTGKLYKRLLKDRYWGGRSSRIV